MTDNFIPPFLMIPTKAVLDKKLKPADKLVLGTILYFERLKHGYCTASNSKIGAISGCSTATARDSISRLNSLGYIVCYYKDDSKYTRERIVTKVSLTSDTRGVSSINERGVVNQRKGVSSIDEQKENNKREYNNKAKDKLSPFVFSDYLKKMEDSPDRRMEVIAFFFKEKGLKFDTEEKVKSAIKRHLRSAKEVANFSDEEIVKAINKVKKDFPEYTIETIYKQLTR